MFWVILAFVGSLFFLGYLQDESATQFEMAIAAALMCSTILAIGLTQRKG